MIVAPEGSFAVTVTPIVIGLPAYGAVFESASATESTTPSSVMSTLVGLAPIAALTLPVASCEPLPFVPEYSVTANVSLPAGAVTATEHEIAPFDDEHPVELGVRFCVTAGVDAPFTEIVSDCVLGEMYFGA